MARFRIEVLNEVCRQHDGETWWRMVAWLRSTNVVYSCRSLYPRHSFVYEGDGPAEFITVLQAAARGDDLGAVLDLVGAKPAYW